MTFTQVYIFHSFRKKIGKMVSASDPHNRLNTKFHIFCIRAMEDVIIPPTPPRRDRPDQGHKDVNIDVI